MIDRLARFMAMAALSAVCSGAAIAADAPFASTGALDRHIEIHRRDLERALEAYNRKHRLVVATDARWAVDILSWKIDALESGRAVLFLKFEVGDKGWGKARGEDRFGVRWADGGFQLVPHRLGDHRLDASSQTAEVAAADASVTSRQALESYLELKEPDIRRKLGAYNKKHRVVVSETGSWGILDFRWKIDRLEGNQAFLEIRYTVGQRGWAPSTGEALFELRWEGDDLEFASHGPIPKRRGAASGWLETGDNNCIHNYYAPRPCSGVVRRWTEFAETHGLALNPESAAIYQSYKHSDFATGDRLMARARGLPDPDGGSAFGLLAEVRALNLTRYQGSAEGGCDLNPLAPKPCIEILPIYREFVRRHGLAEDASSATMFEAYAQGNYKKADVIYALTKGLDVPAYGYLPTVAARGIADLRMRIDQIWAKYKWGCDFYPYGIFPCPEIIGLWREFAARYQLADDAETARIFEQYANGEYRAGDQLLAQAKGVSLEQLLEASGVPTEGLVIEVYPGTPQRLERGRTGT